MSLSELAERCEQAAGPDRELDEAIAAAVHLKQLTYSSPEWIKDPEFTTSLDGALTLLDLWEEHPEWQITRRYCTGYHASVGTGDDCVGCASPALAFCAAALRAQANVTGEQP